MVQYIELHAACTKPSIHLNPRRPYGEFQDIDCRSKRLDNRVGQVCKHYDSNKVANRQAY